MQRGGSQEDEIVGFFHPIHDETTIFIPSRKGGEAEALNRLNAFATANNLLIFQVLASGEMLAVHFHSKYDGRKALELLKPQALPKSGSKRNSKYAEQARPFRLRAEQCFTLATHYLGFNGWSTEIVAVAESEEEQVLVANVNLMDGRVSQGIGVCMKANIPIPREEQLKIATSAALQAAFGRLHLVLLDGVCKYVYIVDSCSPPPVLKVDG
ncbi:unnamed protein product [Chrysoparadoxa australica]